MHEKWTERSDMCMNRSILFRRLDSICARIYNRSAGIPPEVCASPLFLPTDYETEPSSADGCHAPAQATGDGKSLLRDTGLLNIAGEKMAGSGTLGYLLSKRKDNPDAFFICIP